MTSENRNDDDVHFSLNPTHDLRKTSYSSLYYSDIFKIKEKQNHYVIEYLSSSDYLIVEYLEHIKAYINFADNKLFTDPYGNLMSHENIIIGGDWQNYGVESLLPKDYILGRG